MFCIMHCDTQAPRTSFSFWVGPGDKLRHILWKLPVLHVLKWWFLWKGERRCNCLEMILGQFCLTGSQTTAIPAHYLCSVCMDWMFWRIQYTVEVCREWLAKDRRCVFLPCFTWLETHCDCTMETFYVIITQTINSSINWILVGWLAAQFYRTNYARWWNPDSLTVIYTSIKLKSSFGRDCDVKWSSNDPSARSVFVITHMAEIVKVDQIIYM